MTDHNTFRSAVFVLLIFAVIYFIALGIYELKKWITKLIHKKKEEE